MKPEMTLHDVRTFAANVAVKRGWVLNPDEEFIGTILNGLLTNYRTLGYLQCPCRDSWEDREKDRDILCPCEYASADIEEFGHCYCALFLSEEFAVSGAEPESIPERRPGEFYP